MLYTAHYNMYFRRYCFIFSNNTLIINNIYLHIMLCFKIYKCKIFDSLQKNDENIMCITKYSVIFVGKRGERYSLPYLLINLASMGRI